MTSNAVYNNIFAIPIPSPVVYPLLSLAQFAVPVTLTLPLWIFFYSAISHYTDYIRSRSWRRQDPRISEEYDFVVG